MLGETAITHQRINRSLLKRNKPISLKKNVSIKLSPTVTKENRPIFSLNNDQFGPANSYSGVHRRTNILKSKKNDLQCSTEIKSENVALDENYNMNQEEEDKGIDNSLMTTSPSMVK